MADYKGTQHDPRLERLRAQARAACDRAVDLKRRAEDVLADNAATRQLVADTMLSRPPFATRRDLLHRARVRRLRARG